MPELYVLRHIQASKVLFKSEVEYTLGIDGSYRSLYSADDESSDLVIELVANIEKVKGYWNTVTNHFSDASGSIENISELSSYQVNAQHFSVTPEYISIENISNNNVELIDFNTQNNQVNVTFSTEEEDAQEFAFDIIYDNPRFSEESLTVDAIVEQVQNCPDTIHDIDGNIYEVVSIGGKCWIKENLKVRRLNDGTSLIEVTSDTNKSSNSYTYYHYNEGNTGTYGLMYMYDVVYSEKLCPEGWRIPTSSDFYSLSQDDITNKLDVKFGGLAVPELPSTPTSSNDFYGINEKAVFWTYDDFLLWNMPTFEIYSDFYVTVSSLHQYGYASCRCIKED